MLGKAAYAGGRAVNALAPTAASLVRGGVGAAVASQLGDYQIADPGVDSSAAGTFNSLRAGDFSGAGRGLSKGALEAGMDLGGSVAKGVDFLTSGKAGAEQGYNNFLRGQFGDQLRIGGAGAPAAAPKPETTSAASATGGAPTDPKTGLTPQGTANTAALDNIRTSLNNDPGMRQGMTNAQVGAINPTGRVTATRQSNGVMSFGDGGRGPVSGAVSYVGGNGEALPGAGLRGNGFGTVSTVPGMSKEQIAAVMGRPVAGGGSFNPNMTAAQNAQYNREVADAQRINAFTAAQGRISSLRQEQKPVDVSRLPGESRAAYATRINAMVGMRGQDFSETQDVRRDGTSRRGQDLNYDSTLRGQSVQMRGQDMDLQGRILPKQMEMEYNARMRAARAQIFQQAGGDPAKAAQIAQSYGMDGKDFLDAATSSEALGAARVKSGRAALENMSITQDKDGNPVISEAVTAQNAAIANQLTEGRWNSMSAAERAAATPRVQAGSNVFQGMNNLRDTGLLQAVGLDPASPAYDKLPDMQGAKEGTVGFFEGAMTPKVSVGDRKVTLRDGSVRYIPNGKLGDAERTLLREMGVTLQGN